MSPIAFLLGAGASYEYGVPMMREFYSGFLAHVQDRYPTCAKLAEKLASAQNRSVEDLETLMTDLQTVLGVAPGLTMLGVDGGEVAAQIDLARELRGYLDAYIIDTCERFDREHPHRDLASILSLAEHGPVWLFTTNYDRIIEHACEARRVDYSDGFVQNRAAPVANWCGVFDAPVRIVKLHGSVNWYVDDDQRNIHRLDRGYALPAHDFRLVRREHTLRPLMIIPTLEKQTTSEPYVQLATHFSDVLREVKVLVVIGNSLRDDHIRGVIQTRLESLHVLLVNPAAGTQQSVLGRPDRTYLLPVTATDFYRHGTRDLPQLAAEMLSASTDSVGGLLQHWAGRVEAVVAEEAAWTASDELRAARKALDSPSVIVRRDAISVLAKETHPAVVERIRTLLLGDESAEVRMASVSALLTSRDAMAVEVLADVCMKDISPPVRLEAALALGSLLPNELARQALLRAAGEGRDAMVGEVVADLCPDG